MQYGVPRFEAKKIRVLCLENFYESLQVVNNQSENGPRRLDKFPDMTCMKDVHNYSCRIQTPDTPRAGRVHSGPAGHGGPDRMARRGCPRRVSGGV